MAEKRKGEIAEGIVEKKEKRTIVQGNKAVRGESQDKKGPARKGVARKGD